MTRTFLYLPLGDVCCRAWTLFCILAIGFWHGHYFNILSDWLIFLLYYYQECLTVINISMACRLLDLSALVTVVFMLFYSASQWLRWPFRIVGVSFKIIVACIEYSITLYSIQTRWRGTRSNLASKFGQIGPKWDKSGNF